MRSVWWIIETLGGTKAVAASIGAQSGTPYGTRTVQSWSKRKTIPSHTWPYLLTMAKERGVSEEITLDLLVSHSQRRKPRNCQDNPE